MQVLNNQNEPRNANSNNKKIFVIICIYLFLTLTSKYSKNQANSQTKIKNKLLIGADAITPADVVSAFELEEIYQGGWAKTSEKIGEGKLFGSVTGKFQMRVSQVVSFTGVTRYKMEFAILNGQYIDHGVLSFAFYLDDVNFTSDRVKESLCFFLNQTIETQIDYNIQEIMVRVGGGETKLQEVIMNFQLTQNGALSIGIDIGMLSDSFSLRIDGKENRLIKTMIFAGVLFIVSFCSFSAIMKILRDLYELRDNPRNYSLVTICMTCMWDATLCIVAFMYAFSDQQGLMLFIMPAFLLCLLFTNLQPRFMILIYQQSTNSGIREIICKFNLFHYGTLFLIYPILVFTNFNAILFIGMSLIAIPQIYLNGINGHRPELTSSFYTRYLLTRLLIILYLRCWPYNVFGFEPNYLLSVVCILLAAGQYSLLYVQKRYGSKKVIPAFLLDPVYNYKLQEEINVQEGIEVTQCSICLCPLNTEPAHDPNQLQFQPSFKLMQTPCGHKYHSRCLMVWMKVKMECPQCRYKLPPFE